MKMFPKHLPFKKYHKVNKSFLSLLEQKAFFPSFCEYGIQAKESGKLTFKQIEACRRTLRRGLGKAGYFRIRVFTNSPVYTKPIASRMGKGKGGLSHWIAPIQKGQVIFEINCSTKEQAYYVLNKASSKLPIKIKIVSLKF